MRAYGWDTSGRTAIPAEAEEIRGWATYLLADTDPPPTRQGLARDLRARGVSTVSGAAWSPVVIRRALTAPRMIGKRFGPDGELVDADIEPILDADTWHQLRALLLDPELQKFAPSRTAPSLLTGYVRHAACGQSMGYNGRPGATTAPVMSCTAPGCSAAAIRVELIEADVTERVLARLTDPSYRRKLARAIAKVTRGADPDQAAAEVRERLAVLGTDYADGRIERETMLAGTERARARLAVAERAGSLTEMLDELDALPVEDILSWWEAAGVERQREVIGLLLDHVDVRSSEGRTVVGADRLDYVWH